MLTDVWRDLKETLVNHTVRVSEQDHRIEVKGGGVVDMWSLDSANSVRGRKYKRIVVDEAAMVKDLENAWNAVIRPTLTDFQGDAWFPSTPMGMGYFKRLYDFGQDTSDPKYADWASWRIPSITNTTIKGLAEEIESAKDTMPERIFAQEYLAEFLDDSGGVFRKVMEAAIAEKQEEAIDGHEYVIGIDWGKHHDFTVFTVLDTTTKEAVNIDRSNKVDYILQRKRLGVLADKFKTKTLIPELNSIGEPNIEELKRSGFKVHPFHTTNTSKAEAVDALSLAFERGDLKIIKDTVLISELLAYEAERLPSGLLRYSAPAGMHDDCVMSLMMAWSAVASPPRKILYA